MNKKGELFFGIFLGLFLFVIGVLFIPFLTDDITTARTDLNCENPASLTGGVMLECLTIDLVAPYLIWFFVSLAIGYIIGK